MDVSEASSSLDRITPVHATDVRLNRVWYATLGLYLTLTLWLIERFRYSLYPDATSYLSIAEAYSRGEFWNGVNGYWAPLYCWLLTPLLLAGVDRLLAPKLLALLIGVVTAIGLRRLCRQLGLSVALCNAMLVAVVPWLVYWSLSYVTPDFLLVCVLTWYLSAVFDTPATSGASAGLRAGALGALAYLAKQYAMPFIGAHLLLTGLVRWRECRSAQERALVRQWLIAAYVAFVGLSLPWIVTMSTKYDRITISGAGSYNWYLHGPGAKGRYNVGTQGLVAPPFAGAVSAWVDPTLHVPYRAWNDENYTTLARYKVRQILNTGWLAAVTVARFTLLGFPILFAGLIIGARAHARVADRWNRYLALTVLLFLTGYILVADEILERLVWICVILLLVLAARLFERVGRGTLRGACELGAIAILVVSFWLLPVRRTLQEIDDGKPLGELAERLERTYGLDGRVATLNRYADSLRIAFLTRTAFYGRLSQDADIDEVLADLRAHRIDYLLIWTDGESPAGGQIARELMYRFPDRTGGQLAELRILALKQGNEHTQTSGAERPCVSPLTSVLRTEAAPDSPRLTRPARVLS